MAATRSPFAHGWTLTAAGAEHRRGPKRILLSAQSELQAKSSLETISPLTLDVLILMLDGLQRRPEGFLLPLTSVLAAKGSTRRGAERDPLIAQVSTAIALCRRLALRTRAGPQALFIIERSHANTERGAWEEAAYIQPGPGLKSRPNGSNWVSLPASVVALDHRSVRGADVLAKKLAIAIHLEPKVEFARELLSRIGESVDRDVEPRGGRVAARFEAALARLQASTGVCVRQSAVHPRQKGWLRAWLDAPMEVTFEPVPSAVPS